MVEKSSKLNDEKRLTELIKNISKEEFAQQEKKTSQTLLVEISPNNQAKNRKSWKKVLDLRKSIKFTEN